MLSMQDKTNTPLAQSEIEILSWVFPLHFKIRKGNQSNIVYNICSNFLLSRGERLFSTTLFCILTGWQNLAAFRREQKWQ